MKLLFINSSNSENIEDPLLAGFTETLGSSKLVVFPDNLKHEEHVIFCQDELSDLIDKARNYSEREQIAAPGI